MLNDVSLVITKEKNPISMNFVSSLGVGSVASKASLAFADISIPDINGAIVYSDPEMKIELSAETSNALALYGLVSKQAPSGKIKKEFTDTDFSISK